MRSQRLVALFLLGVVLFNYPVLSLFSREGTVLGLPLLFAYLLSAWAAFIVGMAVLARSAARASADASATVGRSAEEETHRPRR